MSDHPTTREVKLPEFVQKRWQRNNRILFLTAIATVVIVIAGAIAQLPAGELLILATLSIFCWDALNERINILDGIEGKVDKLQTDLERRSGQLEAKFDKVIASRTLKTREQLLSIREQVQSATEITMLLVSGGTIISDRENNFRDRLRSNECDIKIILLNPDSPARNTYELMTGFPVRTEIVNSLTTIKNHYFQANKEKCHVKLLDVFLPFSILAADTQNDNGTIVVEYQPNKFATKRRASVVLTAEENLYWYNDFKRAFDEAWNAASDWDGESYLS